MRLLAFAAIIAGVVLFILSMRDSSASAVKRFVIPIGCVVLGVLLLVLPRIFHQIIGGPVGFGFLGIIAFISLVAGIVLFILGMRNPSASRLKRVVIPVLCVVLAILLFIIPMLGRIRGGEASDGSLQIDRYISSSDVIEVNYIQSDDVETTWVQFTAPSDGYLSVYDKASDGNDYSPDIWIYNSDMSYTSLYTSATWGYTVEVEKDCVYYVSTYFKNTELADSVYVSYGRAYYELYFEFVGDVDYCISSGGSTNVAYFDGGYLDLYNSARLFSYECAPGETVSVTFNSADELFVRMYDENHNFIQDSRGTTAGFVYTSDRYEYVYFIVTTNITPPGCKVLMSGYSPYFEATVESN